MTNQQELIKALENLLQSAKDPQLIAKKAVRKLGLQIHFCTACCLIECEPGKTPNLWVATGCGCCKLGHDLL